MTRNEKDFSTASNKGGSSKKYFVITRQFKEVTGRGKLKGNGKAPPPERIIFEKSQGKKKNHQMALNSLLATKDTPALIPA